MKTILSFIGAFFLFISCNNEKKDTTKVDSDTSRQITDTANRVPDTAYVPLAGHAQAIFAETFPDTVVSGTATFDTTSKGKVRLVLELMVPAKAGKSIAVHIHEHGDCGDKGEMSHGHWNPENTEHGKWGTSKFHAGDIGNVKLDANGKGSLSMESDRWTIGGSHSTNILKKAIIVHGGMDDYKTQPAGNAGSRIGCGIIK